MTDDSKRHNRHGESVTDKPSEHAAMTLMTDVLPFPSMTHDTSPLVRPHARAGQVHTEKPSQASSVSHRRPPWLHDGPLTDRVRLISCNRCRRPVLEALADGLIALKVDLIRLTPLAELEHLVAGGHTLMLWPDPPLTAVQRLGFRNQWHIRAHPGRGLPEHNCALNHGPADTTILATPTTASYPEEPPF